MDSIQTWFESLPLCVHSALWKWSKSEGVKKSMDFHLKAHTLCQYSFGSINNNIHGFQPNFVRSIPSVYSFIPVNMS